MRLKINWLAGVIMIGTGVVNAAEPAKTLREAVGDRLLIGSAVTTRQMENAGQSQILSTQFNSLTAGNDFKPDALQKVQGQFRFESADKYVAYAHEHNMKLIGHTLVWHSQAPKFLFEDAAGKPLPREQGLANMKDHITAVVTHFKGKVVGWDVVNEALDDGPNDLRDTPARRSIGDDYIIKAFEYAHAADPDVELYYNDYNIEKPYKRAKTIRLLRSLKDAGVHITAVGIQAHCMVTDQDEFQHLDQTISEFAGLGLKVMLTELDVDVLPRKTRSSDISVKEEAPDPYKAGLPQEIADKQADYYAKVFDVVLKHPDVVTRVTFWGLDDGSSWLNNFPVRGRTNYAMLWYRDLTPKPAFQKVLDVLNRH